MSREPHTLVEHAAAAGCDRVEEILEKGGASVVRVLLLVAADDTPVGELDSTLTGVGFDDELDLLAALLSHARLAARELGITLELFEVHKGEG